MSLAEIEAELEKLSADELRHLAVTSWTAFLQKKGQVDALTECSEDDATLLASLDQAIERADAVPGQGLSSQEVRARIKEWISK